MKELTTFIKSLTKEETRSFKIYSSRIDIGDDKKVVLLFDYIKDEKYEEDDDELIKIFFPNGDKNPYYRLKNRLFEDIEKSQMLLHALSNDRVSALTYVNIANNLEKKNFPELAYFFLKKAERKALKGNYLDLLFVIYGSILQLSTSYSEIDPEYYNKLYIENNEKYKLTMEANATALIINHKLKKSNFTSNELPEKVLNEVIADLNISNKVHQIGSVRLSNHECLRDVLLVQKKFVQLEEYLIRSLKEFEKEKLFNEDNFRSKLLLIVWIINTLNKNKKYTESSIYNEILYQEIVKFDKRYFNDFIFSYYQGLMIDHMVKWNLNKGVELLEELKNNKSFEINRHYSLFLHLNLISLYYLQENYNQAIKNLVPLLQKDVYKQQSIDIQMVIAIVEVLLQYEQDDEEYVINKVAYYERTFKDEFQQEQYQRQKLILGIVKYSITKDGGWKNKYVLGKVEEFLKLKPEFELGSNETIDYNLWIKSKMNNLKYSDLYQSKAMS
jgi:hypothetical protein